MLLTHFVKPMKLKHAILWTFCVLTLSPETFAQSGLSMGYSGSYLHSYRRLKNVNGDPREDKYIADRNEMESPLGAVQFSIDGVYQYKNNMNLSFGAGYSNTGFQYKNLKLSDPVDPNNKLYNLDNADVKIRLMQLSLPIMIGYKLSLGSGDHHVLLFRLGFNNHITIKTTYTTVLNFNDGTKEKEVENMGILYYFPYNLSACANIGYYYKMKRHSVGINLSGDYGVSPINDWSDSVKLYPYYLGIGLSYLYAFHKY